MENQVMAWQQTIQELYVEEETCFVKINMTTTANHSSIVFNKTSPAKDFLCLFEVQKRKLQVIQSLYSSHSQHVSYNSHHLRHRNRQHDISHHLVDSMQDMVTFRDYFDIEKIHV